MQATVMAHKTHPQDPNAYDPTAGGYSRNPDSDVDLSDFGYPDDDEDDESGSQSGSSDDDDDSPSPSHRCRSCGHETFLDTPQQKAEAWCRDCGDWRMFEAFSDEEPEPFSGVDSV